MNSFRFLERGIEAEIAPPGADPRRGRRGRAGDAALRPRVSGALTSLRSKEEAHDYRYFPEPDLVPLAPTEAMLERARAALPELPAARAERFERELGLTADDGASCSRSAASSATSSRRRWRRRRRDPRAGSRTGSINELRRALGDARPGANQARAGRARAAGGAGRGQAGRPRPRHARCSACWSPRAATPRRSSRSEGLGRGGGATSWAAIVDRAIAANPDAVEKMRGRQGPGDRARSSAP